MVQCIWDLIDLPHYSRMQRHGTTNGKRLLGEVVKINIIDRGGPMSMLEVIALTIFHWRWPTQVEDRKAKPISLVIYVVWILVQTWPI